MEKSRYDDWLRQAQEDLKWGKDTLGSGYFPQACFIAQQVAEKSLKALVFHRKFAGINSHSIVKIAAALDINGEILNAGKRLDQYYISTRYPDAMPDGIPSEFITGEQAREAIQLAEIVLEKILTLIHPERL
jgi:HEPN domain-containing protein